MAERQAGLDFVHVRVVHLHHFAQTTTALGALSGEQMAFARVSGHDFASGRDLKSLGH